MKSPHIIEVKVLMKLEKEADDSYIVTCPQLGCIFVHEASEEAAYRGAREAVDAYFQSALAHGDNIPDEVVVEQIHIKRRRSKSTELPMTGSYMYA